MDIGQESMKEQTLETMVRGDVPSFDAAMELMESAMLMQTESEELMGLVTLADNLGDIAASMKKNQIDAGTEALVGKELLGFCGKFDKEDVPGTIAAVETGLEGVGEKIMSYIAKLIENMKQFIEKLIFNRSVIVKSFRIQWNRVALLGTKVSWSNKEKVISVSKDPELFKDVIGNMKVIDMVLAQLADGNWKISAKTGGIIASGEAVKQLRAKMATDKDDLSCGKVTPANGIARAKNGEACIESLMYYDNLRAKLKSFKLKPIKVESADIKPARMVSYCNQYVGMIGIAMLRDVRSYTAILRNIK